MVMREVRISTCKFYISKCPSQHINLGRHSNLTMSPRELIYPTLYLNSILLLIDRLTTNIIFLSVAAFAVAAGGKRVD